LLQLNLLWQSIYKDENLLHAYLSDYAFLEDIYEIRLKASDKNGDHEFVFDDKFITRDTWGVHLTFKLTPIGKNVRFLQDIKETSIILKPRKDLRNLHAPPVIDEFKMRKGKIEY
jgi:hypothetical protein